MSYTSDDLATLRRALVDPTKSVTFSDGRQVTYRTVAEIQSAMRTVEAALAVRPRPTHVHPDFQRRA
ncbi:phage head-tail joining protein [Pseudoroseicyclus sp. CXY001]|uniref:phage head-tail joining protein n=1 Tax=Pseudoroseicyclus sp. CXY001 TaxID=3242492 RepID=UPI0035709A35